MKTSRRRRRRYAGGIPSPGNPKLHVARYNASMKRQTSALCNQTFDLLVLGGGITGAGVALDAVLRGLRVALIDKGDFASGTSSASSKLVHGGFRYLEHGGLHLVYEALHERTLLLRNAPHLVRPLRFIVPFRRDMRVPSWKWRTGLTLYDLLSGHGNLRRSRPINVAALRHEFPALKSSGLLGGAEYYDAQMDDARLCIEVIQSAAAHGACVANYVEAITFYRHGNALSGVLAVDHVGGEQFAIQARQILNATGPWVDSIRRLADEGDSVLLDPTKGVHLVVPGRNLAAAFLLLHPRDGRVFFVIPWMRKTLIGTTDTKATESPDQLAVTDREIAYLLEGHNYYFAAELQPADVLGSFAGLRPLLRTGAGEPSSLSREYRIFTSPAGLVSVAGGKYTTYRRMAEVITDTLVRRLGKRRQCRTRDCRLDGTPVAAWQDYERSQPRALAASYGIALATAQHLVGRYGRNAEQVAQYAHNNSAAADDIVAGEPDIHAELAYQREHEMAVYAQDSLLRRTRLGLFHPSLMKAGNLGKNGEPHASDGLNTQRPL